MFFVMRDSTQQHSGLRSSRPVICCHGLTLLSFPLQFQDTLELSIKVISSRPVVGSAVCDRQTYLLYARNVIIDYGASKLS